MNEDLIKLLKQYNIKNYTIHEDGSVSVIGDVDLSNKCLYTIPIVFREVSGSFNCYNNNLTSLEHCPKIVGSYFDCSYNNLTSLKHCPKIVGGYFGCSNNNLTSLEHCPKIVSGGFYCSYNNLTSLEHCPKIVGSNFYCSNNNLILLELEKAPKPSSLSRYELEKLLTWQDGKDTYRIFDGIFCKVISKKGNVYKVDNLKGKILFVIDDGNCYSHGETIDKARESLIYKISDRDISKYEGMNKDTILSKKDCIEMYRVITGACEYGVRSFVEGLKEVKDEYNVKEVVELTRGQFGNNKLVEMFG